MCALSEEALSWTVGHIGLLQKGFSRHPGTIILGKFRAQRRESVDARNASALLR